MKTSNILSLIVLFFLFSCSKSNDLVPNAGQPRHYSLTFDIDNDVNCTYHIQTSSDGKNFSDIKDFDTASDTNGSYGIDLDLAPMQQVRLQVINNLDGSVTNSVVLIAD